MKRFIRCFSYFALPIVMAGCTEAKGQKLNNRNYSELSWKEVATKMPEEWYASDEAKIVADSVLKYQTETGGWPKNSAFHKLLIRKNMPGHYPQE